MPNVMAKAILGNGEVRVYKGTVVSRGVWRTTWERSLEKWGLQIHSFKEVFWGRNTLGLVPCGHPHSLGYACTLYAPTSPLPKFLLLLIHFLFCQHQQMFELWWMAFDI